MKVGEASGAAQEAAAWLAGEGDLVTAGMGRRVTVIVQLGVLAHGSFERLGDLGRYCERASVRRAWGTKLAQFAGELAQVGGNPDGLRRLQYEVLVPFESDVLAGRRPIAGRWELIAAIRESLDHLPDASSHAEVKEIS